MVPDDDDDGYHDNDFLWQREEIKKQKFHKRKVETDRFYIVIDFVVKHIKNNKKKKTILISWQELQLMRTTANWE